MWRMLVLSTLLAMSTVSAVAQDAGLVPGQRVGAVAVGMSANAAIAAAITTFGSAPTYTADCTTDRDRQQGVRCFARGWAHQGYDVIMLLGAPGEERVAAVVTERRAHRTAEGIGVGSTLDDVIRAYGEPRAARCSPACGGLLLAPSHAILPADTHRDTWWAAAWRTRGLGVFYDRTTRGITVVVVFAPEP